jgi:hypothetical protein
VIIFAGSLIKEIPDLEEGTSENNVLRDLHAINKLPIKMQAIIKRVFDLLKIIILR